MSFTRSSSIGSILTPKQRPGTTLRYVRDGFDLDLSCIFFSVINIIVNRHNGQNTRVECVEKQLGHSG